ncbi:MAG: ABC transporter ATP-binding protein [SAR86 cluster bacterium]|nr:ABC transporter ATP-binding protein [SAR86 cluster bacterium]
MVIEVINLYKAVSLGEEELVILNDISFDLREGASLAIVGPSGSGKSTLLGLLAGLDSVSSGEVYLNNSPLHKLNEEKRAIVRKENVAFVFQSFELLPGLTAIENVMLPLELQGNKNAEDRAQYFLKRVELEKRENHYPRQLSGGEQQRVAIARAFACNAKVLFADEPTGNLDPETSLKISNLLFEVNAETKNSLIVVTHDKNLAQKCDAQIELIQGKIK